MPRKRKASISAADSKTEEPTEDAPPSKEPRSESSQVHTMEPYPASKVYRLIEPGPVLLVSTGSLTSKTHNIMTIGFHTMLQHDSPALIGACIGPWDASFESLKSHGECVLAVPDVSIAEKVVDIGNCSGDEVDKWSTFKLDAVPAETVQAPLVGGPGVIANIECVVVDRRMVPKYNMWVLKAVRAWLNPELKEQARIFHHRGDGTFVVDGEVLNLQERMVKWKEFQD
ncbi:hypothetical protein N7510_009166 [Penicillium lagena]|uniref:uncharacterized protein n=1 Tax=Penicillium lagena TaxID=94218 RepID=UPI00253FFC04|nr:uncharacterized protein N7510_009166 [Penicillium lagena]KAJ5606385.1 hypothetical protein N7510_009166 [Penicillium lagena]